MLETAIAPAPTTPAPTPAPPPPVRPPAPPPSPTPPAPSETDSGGEDPFAAMDKRILSRRESAKQKEAEKTEEPKQDKPATDAAPAPDKKPALESAPAALRKALEKANAELKGLTDEKTSLMAKIEAAEAKGKDVTVLSEKLAKLEKDLEESRAEARQLKGEQSPEFKERYEKPFNQAADYAKNIVERMAVYDENGQPVGKASWDQHFIPLYHLHRDDPTAAIEKAETLFGKGAQIVLNHIQELDRRHRERDMAAVQEKEQYAERQKTMEAENVKRREGFKLAQEQAEKALSEKYPEWYSPTPDDKEGQELIAEGRKLVEMKPKTFNEAVTLTARNRLNLIAFPWLADRYEKAKAELAALKEENAKLRGSGPGPSPKQGTSDASTPKTWKDELRETMAGT